MRFAYADPPYIGQAKKGVTRGGAWMAQQSGLARMRRRLVALGITSAEDLLL